MIYLPLSAQQIAYFNTFGFLKCPGMLADQIADVQKAFQALFNQHGGGHAGQAHDGKSRSCIVPFADQSARLSALLDDPRIKGIAASLLGEDFNYMGSDGNYYVGDTGWHSDGWHTKVKHLKIAFYLDDLTGDTGALRVIAGSHHVGDTYAEALQKELADPVRTWGMEGRDVPAIALNVTPGDILVFNHNTKHAAYGGGNQRRMFTMNCCQRYPEHLIHELKDYVKGYARFWLDRAYGAKMVETATPERWVHLEQLHSNDGHLAELTREAKKRMTEPSRG